jgi:translation initiation factor 3 subunit I
MRPIKLQVHEKPINVVKLNYDGDLLFSGSSDKKVNIFYALTGERIGCIVCKGSVKTLDVSDDSKFLVTGSLQGAIEIWEVDGGKQVHQIQTKGKIKYVEFSMGDKQILILYESFKGNQKLFVFNFTDLLQAKGGEDDKEFAGVKPVFEKAFTYNFTQISWGLVNKYFIGSTEKGDLLKLSLEGEILESAKAHAETITQFSFSKDYSMLITASKDGSKVYDPETLKVLKFFRQDFQMNAACISPLYLDKGTRRFHAIMAGGVSARDAALVKQGGFEIHLCHLVYEEELGSISGHFGPVNTLTFHNDGRGFVSGGEEGIIIIWRFDLSYFENKSFE